MIVDPIRTKFSLDIYGFLLKLLMLVTIIVVFYLMSFIIKSKQLLEFRIIVN